MSEYDSDTMDAILDDIECAGPQEASSDSELQRLAAQAGRGTRTEPCIFTCGGCVG